MKSKYNTVLWDWNGTIIDDLNANYTIINMLLNQNGCNSVSMKDYRNTFCFPIIDFYRKIGLPVEGEEYKNLVKNYWLIYHAQSDNIQLMSDALSIVKLLRENGVKQYILSASEKQTIISQMDRYDIKYYFDDVISQIDGYATGKIELAKDWIEQCKVNPLDVLMIGDTLHDYETAKAIGVNCILVNCGHQNLANIQNDDSLTVIERICELKEILF